MITIRESETHVSENAFETFVADPIPRTHVNALKELVIGDLSCRGNVVVHRAPEGLLIRYKTPKILHTTVFQGPSHEMALLYHAIDCFCVLAATPMSREERIRRVLLAALGVANKEDVQEALQLPFLGFISAIDDRFLCLQGIPFRYVMPRVMH